MGANTFTVRERGKTVAEAFRKAVKEAQYEHGHGGYTGTIAEKDEFVLIPLPQGLDPEKFAHGLIDQADQRIDDKWGPAGAIQTAPGEWLFFGWASS